MKPAVAAQLPTLVNIASRRSRRSPKLFYHVTKCWPWFTSFDPNAKLIHRVRGAAVYRRWASERMAIFFVCGNGGYAGRRKGTLLAKPSFRKRKYCSRCQEWEQRNDTGSQR